MLSSQIESKINALWDKFWSGGIANPLTAIEQISYLLFMKRIDEEDLKLKADAEFTGEKFTSLFKGKQNNRWSRFRHLEGGEMLDHVQQKVFPFIKALGKEDQPFAEHMKDAVFMIPKPSLLVEAVGIIDDIYVEIERERQEGQQFQDTMGDVYEKLLSEIASAGKNGQFRTPRHIIQMMCAMVDPKLGDEVVDPACGTGGFLLGAYQHILTHHTSPKLRQKDENGMVRGIVGDRLTDERQWRVLKEKTFNGFDFDATMVRIGLMNLLTHGLDHARVDRRDTLSKKYTEMGLYDVALANPPFKGSIDKGDINEDLVLKTTKTELLFVNRIYNLLRIGGRAGVIVPDGVLFRPSRAHRDLRKLLIEQCELQGVVSMPQGVFKPYAGVSTAVLFFVKGGVTENVWFYDMAADGYSLDDKRDKVEENDIPDVLERWKKRNPNKDTDRKAKAFFVPAKEIIDNKFDLSIRQYKEIEYEVVEYTPPKEIIKELRILEADIGRNIDELEKMLR